MQVKKLGIEYSPSVRISAQSGDTINYRDHSALHETPLVAMRLFGKNLRGRETCYHEMTIALHEDMKKAGFCAG